MKFGKIIAILMSALLCVTALASCNKENNPSGNNSDETEPVYYTVTFNTATDEKIESKTVKAGTALSEPPEPSRDGYVFEGWYNGTRQWDFSSFVKGNMTLTAHWATADSVFNHKPIEGGELTVITGIKSDKDRSHIKLPTYIGGYRVSTVGEGAFSKLSSEEIRRITVPEGITVIENSAFEGCGDIEIVIEGQILSVGERAFFGCTGLKEIKFGEGIETLSAESFVGSGLKLVALPKSVKVVDENAFFECEDLKILILHDSVETVKDMAFKSSGLESVLLYGTDKTLKTLLEEKVVGQNEEIAESDKYIYSEKKPTAKVPEGCRGFWHYNDKGEAKAW